MKPPQRLDAYLPPPAIIVVTANTFEETQLKTLDMKFDDFIHKPFQVEVLLKTIAKHLGVHYVYEASSPNIEMKLQNKPQQNVETLKSEDFQQLSSEWINQVYLSASELDETKLVSLIEQISQEYSEIASKLMNLLNKYRFDQIVNLIKPNLKC
jgi:DNA-binding response OmpR family regulator